VRRVVQVNFGLAQPDNFAKKMTTLRTNGQQLDRKILILAFGTDSNKIERLT
jgi:hypothetical protein